MKSINYVCEDAPLQMKVYVTSVASKNKLYSCMLSPPSDLTMKIRKHI